MLVGVSIKTPASLSLLSFLFCTIDQERRISWNDTISDREWLPVSRNVEFTGMRKLVPNLSFQLSPDFESLEPRWSDFSFSFSLSRLACFCCLLVLLSLSLSPIFAKRISGVKTMIDNVTRNRQFFNEPLFR